MKALIRCIESLLVAGLIAILMMAGVRTSNAQPRRGGGRMGHTSVVKKLPRGHAKLRVRGDGYFYNNGVFYQRSKGGHAIVHAPIGAVVHRLPRGHKGFRASNGKYFRHNGVFYVKVRRGYRVVAPPWRRTTFRRGFRVPGNYFGKDLKGQNSHAHFRCHETLRPSLLAMILS